jgi:Integrase core domain
MRVLGIATGTGLSAEVARRAAPCVREVSELRNIVRSSHSRGLVAARQWAMQFLQWYNHEHRHSGIRYVTPAQRRAGWDRRLLKARHAVYQSARERNPRRWSGKTRNWTPVSIVTLNPERDA